MKLRSYLPMVFLGVMACGALTAHADYASTVSSLNPLVYMRLNEPTQPIAPTHPLTNSGTLGGTANGLYYGVPTLGQPDALGTDTAVSFNGTGQYAEVPYSAALNPSGPFTVEFWANATNTSAGAKAGVTSRFIGGGLQQGYLFFANNGNTKWQFRVYNGAAGLTVTDVNGPDIQANLWYHVVGVYDGAEIRIYVNGVQSSPATVVAAYSPNTNAPLRMAAGTTEAAPTLFFPGLLDEVAVYSTALTANQIAAHYDAAFTNAAGYASQIQALNPAGYWRLNEPAVPPYVPYAATNSGTLGSAQNGTYNNTTSGVAGPLRGQFAGFETDNKAAALNGTSSSVSIPGFATSTDTFTITGWIKRSGNQVNASPILLQRAPGSPATGLVVDFNNRLGYVWNDDAGTYSYNPGPDFFIPDGLWTFVAVTISPTEAVLYKGSTNGLISVTRPGTYTHSPHDFINGTLQIGRDGGSTTRVIRGSLDEIALFDQTLDAATISNLFYSATPAIINVVRTPANPVFEGVDVTFTAQAVSSAPLNYQWRHNGSPVGGNSPVLLLNNVSVANNGNYEVVVTAGSQSVTSVVDVISVIAGPPVVFTPPVSATRYEGSQVTFSVAAGGTAPFSYQWFHGVNLIPDATNVSHTVTPITTADAGAYSVRVTNPNGNIDSAPATLTVLTLPNSYGPVVLQNQPEAYWRLNEASGDTAFDYAGGLHGTFPAAPAVVPGVAGPSTPAFPGFESGNTAFQLDGVSGWVTAPPLNWNTNTVTFTAWVKLSGYDDEMSGVVFSRGSSASGFHILNGGELRYEWNGGFWGVGSGLLVPLDTWAFVALVIEPDQATLYLGTPSGLSSFVNSDTHGVSSLSDPLYLGRDRTDRPLVGVIDEAAVYKRALSPDDISALYGVGFGLPLELTLTPGGYVADTKPTGLPHHGANRGTTWEASVTDGNITRTGVGQFTTATPSQIVTPAHPDLDSPTGTFTFWMRADAPIPEPGNEGAMLIDRRTTDGAVIVLNDAGAIFVQCAGGANSFTAGYLPDNTWHHVAVTYDQSLTGGVEIFVDGISLGSQLNTTNWAWPTEQPIEIGRSHDGYWKRYNGQLDDLRLYNRILTPTEIASVASSAALVDSAALKLRYNFDESGIGYTVNWPYGKLQSSPVLGPSAIWTDVLDANLPSHPFLPVGSSLFYRATY